MDPVLIIAILAIVASFAVLIFITVAVVPVSHYIYSNAVLQSRSNTMVKPKVLKEMTECKNLNEVKTLLIGTDYQEEFEKKEESVSNYHKAIEATFLNTVNNVLELCPAKLKPLLEAYFMQFETKIIKMLYRSKFLNIEPDDKMLYSIGNVDEKLIEQLKEAKDMEEFHMLMRRTVYKPVFEKEYETLEEFEVKLEEFVVKRIDEVSKKKRIYHHRFVKQIIDYKIDSVNIMTILKLLAREVPKKERAKFIIQNNGYVASKTNELVKYEKISDIVESLRGSRYNTILEEAHKEYKKDQNISHFEEGLCKGFKLFITDNELNYALGPVPVISYVVRKEIEMKNLFLITKMVFERMDPEMIRKKLI